VTLTDPGLYVFKLTTLDGSAYDTLIYLQSCDSIVSRTFTDTTLLDIPDSSYTVKQRIVYDTTWAFFNRVDSVFTSKTIFDTVKVNCAPVPPPAPETYSFFTDQNPPTKSENDDNPVELGIQFKSSVDGYLVGLKFFKTSGNTGIHTGELYFSSGVRIASEQFTNESAMGWQTLTFKTPILITAGTNYVASYLAPNGNYPSGGDNAFPKSVTTGPITATKGVYKYSNIPAFPNHTYMKSNYWVDIIFQKK
jgi:hypothetical protein